MTTLETISDVHARAGYAKWFVRQHYLKKDYCPDNCATSAWAAAESTGKLRYCKQITTHHYKTMDDSISTLWQTGLEYKQPWASRLTREAHTTEDVTWFEIPLDQLLAYFDLLDRDELQLPRLPAFFYGEDVHQHVYHVKAAKRNRDLAQEDGIWRWLIGEADHWVVFYTAWIQAHGVNVRDL